MAHDSPSSTLRAVLWENRPWTTSDAYLSRTQERRHSGPYAASIPATIAELSLSVPPGVTADAEDAVREIVRFDAYASLELGPRAELAPLSSILLRTESAASSQIENLTVGARALALAELGSPTNRNASIVAGNVRAMEAALAVSSTIQAEPVLAMHRALMEPAGDPDAGSWRTRQVWIGGSSAGPHRALFVPPHHDYLPDALDDLFAFTARSDMPVLPHIAIAHAQFETIHPFTDGNGRTGRALVHAMLHRAGVTERVTVPMSAGLLTDTASYFASLDAFRDGDVVPIIASLTRATFDAVSNGRRLVDDLVEARAGFDDRIAARRDSVVWRLADSLIGQPVIDIAYVERTFGVSNMAAGRAIERMVEAGVLTQTSKGRRNRVWQADAVLEALDDFAERIRRASA